MSIIGISGYINAVVTTANNGILKNESGDAIPYSMYLTPDFSYQVSPTLVINYYDATLLGILEIFNSSSAPIPLYLKTQSGNYNLKSGTYTDTIVVNWSWSVCKGIEIGFICLGRSEGETVWTSTVSLAVENDCVINAPDINFGASPLVSSFKPVTQTVSIYCTKDTSYSIGLSDGIHADGKQRRLEHNGNYINYEIYQGGTGTLCWGANGGERRSSLSADVNPGLGSGTNSLLQGFIYQATILPGQTTPPAGVYTDSVILDVTF